MRWSEALLTLLLLPAVLAAAEDPGVQKPQEATNAVAQAAREALELEVRQAALQELTADAEARLAELQKLRGELEAALAPGEAEAGTDLDTLIKFYQSMKAKNAAALLEKLPVQLAADVLGSMKARAAGKILDAMKADRAVVISRRMAETER